jgi:hypothetical protein
MRFRTLLLFGGVTLASPFHFPNGQPSTQRSGAPFQRITPTECKNCTDTEPHEWTNGTFIATWHMLPSDCDPAHPLYPCVRCGTTGSHGPCEDEQGAFTSADEDSVWAWYYENECSNEQWACQEAGLSLERLAPAILASAQAGDVTTLISLLEDNPERFFFNEQRRSIQASGCSPHVIAVNIPVDSNIASQLQDWQLARRAVFRTEKLLGKF